MDYRCEPYKHKSQGLIVTTFRRLPTIASSGILCVTVWIGSASCPPFPCLSPKTHVWKAGPQLVVLLKGKWITRALTSKIVGFTEELLGGGRCRCDFEGCVLVGPSSYLPWLTRASHAGFPH